MVGIIIGCVGASIFWAKFIFYNRQIMELENLAWWEEYPKQVKLIHL